MTRKEVRQDSENAVQLSHGSPLAAVCARGDLDTALPDARGCFDTKVTSYELALELQADAITGPTTAVCCKHLLDNFDGTLQSVCQTLFNSCLQQVGALACYPAALRLSLAGWPASI